MKVALKFEELFMALACLLALYYLQVQWYWYLLFLLGPDISFLGYLGGNKVGAFVYNLFHHKAVAIIIIVWALVYTQEVTGEYFLLAGLVLLGHSSMDRFFGYGLKLSEGFKYTHLGEIGKKQL